MLNLQPLNVYELFNKLELWVSHNDRRPFLTRSSNDKTICVRNGICGFNSRGFNYFL